MMEIEINLNKFIIIYEGQNSETDEQSQKSFIETNLGLLKENIFDGMQRQKHVQLAQIYCYWNEQKPNNHLLKKLDLVSCEIAQQSDKLICMPILLFFINAHQHQITLKMIKAIEKVCKPLLVKNISFAIISKKSPKPTPKQSEQKGKKREIKVSRLKCIEEIGGYKIYETHLSKSFMYVSVGLTSILTVSGLIVFLVPSLGNILTFGCIAGFLYYHQNRLTHTAREIIVDKLGTNVRVRTYGYFGTDIKSSFTQIPIHILYAAKNMSYRRGLRILGGGVFGYAPIYYNFSRCGILDERVFNGVVTGSSVVYADIL